MLNSQSLQSLIKYSIVLAFLVIAQQAFSQDTLKQVFRPRIGVGTGVMTYYGEVQNYQKSFASTVNRFGGSLLVNAPISKAFNIEFSATYAKIASNERTLNRNLNFESRIRMGTAMIYYNFHPLFKTGRRYYNPFLGVGFSSFEFLSKSDLYDRHGNFYHYWSDGSIMSLAENDPLASTAVPLHRDYNYETDLRELNADNLGKYREQSFALPLSAGFEFHMSPRWDFKIAATYYFTFTDLVDNISDAGEGNRKGDPKNDKLLYTHVSLSYDLKLKEYDSEGIGPGMEDEGIPLFAEWDPNDFDKDGVIDALDDCPATPAEALVDEHGCPYDKDQDGVPDYRDDEPDTKLDEYVDEFGVTITEEDFNNHTRLFYDSTGYEHEFAEIRTEVILGKRKVDRDDRKDKTRSGLNYVIIVGSEQKDITVNDLHKFLGYRDYSTVMKGDTVYYTLGEFGSIEEAVAAKAELEQQGVDIQRVGRNSGDNERIITIEDEVIEKVERINIEEGRSGPDYNNTEQLYRVQLGAFSKKVDADKIFPGIEVVYGASDKDNLNRYYTGSFKTYREAENHQKVLAKKGFKETFVVAYDQQKRVTLVDAGVGKEELPENYSEEKELETFIEPIENGNDNTETKDEQLIYRVRLAQVDGELSIETLNILMNIRPLKPVRGANNSTTYYSTIYKTKEERDAALEEFKAYGLDDLQPIIEFEGKFYTDEEFKEKFNR